MQPYLTGTAMGIWNSSGCRPGKASRERHPHRETVRSPTNGKHLMSLSIKEELERGQGWPDLTANSLATLQAKSVDSYI